MRGCSYLKTRGYRVGVPSTSLGRGHLFLTPSAQRLRLSRSVGQRTKRGRGPSPASEDSPDLQEDDRGAVELGALDVPLVNPRQRRRWKGWKPKSV